MGNMYCSPVTMLAACDDRNPAIPVHWPETMPKSLS